MQKRNNGSTKFLPVNNCFKLKWIKFANQKTEWTHGLKNFFKKKDYNNMLPTRDYSLKHTNRQREGMKKDYFKQVIKTTTKSQGN